MHSQRAGRRLAMVTIMIMGAASLLPFSRAAAPIGWCADGRSDGPVDRAAAFHARSAAARRLSSLRPPDPPTVRCKTRTRAVEWVSLNPEIARVTAKGRVFRRPTGRRRSSPAWAAMRSVPPSRFRAMDQPSPVSFRRDVIPAFSQASCNMGACHGTPTGKGGFRLSLRGYLPDQDFAILSREAGGRRINPIAPETSLILRKPLGEVAHEGGLRLSRNSKSYEFLHDWIKEGAKDDPAAPAALALEILPESRSAQRTSQYPAGRGPGALRRQNGSRCDADLLLRLFQPGDCRGRRRRLRSIQIPR